MASMVGFDRAVEAFAYAQGHLTTAACLIERCPATNPPKRALRTEALVMAREAQANIDRAFALLRELEDNQ